MGIPGVVSHVVFDPSVTSGKPSLRARKVPPWGHFSTGKIGQLTPGRSGRGVLHRGGLGPPGRGTCHEEFAVVHPGTSQDLAHDHRGRVARPDWAGSSGPHV